MEQSKNLITSQKKNFARWYQDVILKAQLVDFGLTRGTVVFKPYGWKLWKEVEKYFQKIFEKAGVQEVRLPLLFPESLLEREKEHLRGFAPEVFRITKIGSKKLADPLIIRPTSEIAFADYFRKNILTFRDLPVILNQWCNVLRGEKNVKIFLRGSEFFWQEGHSCHTSAKDAQDLARFIASAYKTFINKILAITTYEGRKTSAERFGGALETFTVESLMPDGQALQCATSHYLAKNFSQSFKIKYQDEHNNWQFVEQTSWGISTRILGALIMSHSDDLGLVLPPEIAPYKVAVIKSGTIRDRDLQNESAKFINSISNYDFWPNNNLLPFKERMNLAITQGIPLRIVLGPKSLKMNCAEVTWRHTMQSKFVNLREISQDWIKNELIKIQSELLVSNAMKINKQTFIGATSLQELRNHLAAKKWVITHWAGNNSAELELQQKYGITIRCLLESSKMAQKCFWSDENTTQRALFARAY